MPFLVIAVVVVALLASLLLREAVLFAVYLAALFNHNRHDMKYIGAATTLVFVLAIVVGILLGGLV